MPLSLRAMRVSSATQSWEFPSKMYLLEWQSEVVTTLGFLWLVLTGGARLWLVERSGWWWWVGGGGGGRSRELSWPSQSVMQILWWERRAAPAHSESERGTITVRGGNCQTSARGRQQRQWGLRCSTACCYWWCLVVTVKPGVAPVNWCLPQLILPVIFPSRSDGKFRNYFKDQSAAADRK